MHETTDRDYGAIEIVEPDILAAMKDIQGYIDISPGDFKEVFQSITSSWTKRGCSCSLVRSAPQPFSSMELFPAPWSSRATCSAVISSPPILTL